MTNATLAEITEQQLIALVAKQPEGDRSRYLLFTGAGASVEAGIPAGSGIIEDLLGQAWREAGNAGKCANLRRWAKRKFAWYRNWTVTPGDLSEYELVITQLKLTQFERTQYFRGLDGKADLTSARGNAALAKLIRRGLFRTILTTNFDTVLGRLYGGQELPDFSAGIHLLEMDPCSTEARLIRLHGELTHGDPANSPAETKAVPGERFDAVLRLLESYGMVVIGYSGADRCLMKDLFGRVEDRHTRGGVFWCLREGESLSEPLRELLNRGLNDLKLVRIGSFADFMAKLAKATARLRSGAERDVRTEQIGGLFLRIAESASAAERMELHRTVLRTLAQITGSERGYLKVGTDRAILRGRLRPLDRNVIDGFRKEGITVSRPFKGSLCCQYSTRTSLTTLGLFGDSLDMDAADGRTFRAILALLHRLKA